MDKYLLNSKNTYRVGSVDEALDFREVLDHTLYTDLESFVYTTKYNKKTEEEYQVIKAKLNCTSEKEPEDRVDVSYDYIDGNIWLLSAENTYRIATLEDALAFREEVEHNTNAELVSFSYTNKYNAKTEEEYLLVKVKFNFTSEKEPVDKIGATYSYALL